MEQELHTNEYVENKNEEIARIASMEQELHTNEHKEIARIASMNTEAYCAFFEEQLA